MSSRCVLVLVALTSACGGFDRGDPLPEDIGDAPASSGDASGELSFAADVYPILSSKCSTCHGQGGVAVASSFHLSGSASTDYPVVLHLVSTSAPTSSTLLQRASGVSHGGGTVLAPASADYQTIETWIAQGAAP